MTETRLDWAPVVRSLVLHLVNHDIIPVTVYDGAYRTSIPCASTEKMAQLVADAACCVDEASLRCIFHHEDTELRCSLLLVFGNDPDELVADYSYPPDYPSDALEAQIELALNDFQAQWEGKTCPCITLTS